SNPYATASGTEQRRPSIRVKRGDTLFAISRRNAVQGVTVYQMMVALQRANPKAFIHDNMNLVRAGATLHMPDRAALIAVSDAEARRIFVRQAQAFAQYRQRLAAQRAALAQPGSAEQGRVGSVDTPNDFNSGSVARDQLVLSMPGRSDAADDQQAATSKNIRESQQRVSQLEENVKSLNQALRSQGEAARSAVVEGVTSLGESLSEVAETLTPTTSGSNSPSDDAGASETDDDAVLNGAPRDTNNKTGPGGSTTGTGLDSTKGVGNAATVESQTEAS